MPFWWDQFAGDLQARNRITEAEKDDQFTDAEVRRAVVYAREDLTGLWALLSSLNLQVSAIRFFAVITAALAAILTCLAAIIACRVFGLF